MYPSYQLTLANLLDAQGRRAFIQPKEVKQYIPSLDDFKYGGEQWVVDISGSNLKLISYIDFRSHKIFVRHIISHVEYNRLTAYYRDNKE